MTLEKKFERSRKLIERGRFADAFRILKDLEDKLVCKEVYLNLGNCYKHFGNDYMASKCYLMANDTNTPFINGLRINAPFNQAQNNLGILAAVYGMDREAINYFNKALLYCDNLGLRSGIFWNLSHTLLKKYCSGKPVDIDSAWFGYDARFMVGECSVFSSAARWDGSYVDKLVVLYEQGCGDRLMFGRYLSALKSRVGRVVVQTTPGERTFYENDTILLGEEVDCPAIGVCSLARMIGGVPAGDWLAHRLAYVPSSELRIGIVSGGSKYNGNDSNRSVSLRKFDRFKTYGKVVTLNPAEHCDNYENYGNYTWSDTIEALGKVDVVISVDTAIVHLCGSMGVPCIAIMPYKQSDFRWGDDSMGDRNIWYDSVRVVRNPQSWEYAFDMAERMLNAGSK